MIVLDASALIALARSEPAAAEVEEVIRSGDAAISAVNAAEVTDILLRRHAVALETFDALVSKLEVRPAALAEARRAGELRARYYHRTRRPLSLADCFLLASAGSNDRIATSDQAIVDTAAAEGLSVVPLRNSSGVRARRPR